MGQGRTGASVQEEVVCACAADATCVGKVFQEESLLEDYEQDGREREWMGGGHRYREVWLLVQAVPHVCLDHHIFTLLLLILG